MMFSFRKKKSFIEIFKIITIILLILGIFLRFANIERKNFWADETFTHLRIYGHTKSELKEEVSKSQILSPKDLLNKYQLPAPDKNYLNIIQGLALEDPKHTPLYFIMARFWVDIFGNTVAATRSLSAAIALLVFPCLYWLCLELFQSSSVGLVAIAILTVSPFHILYAQEARMYSLLTLMILLSSATLLRAIRVNSKFSWSIYAVSLSLGFYTHSLFNLVAIGQGIYVFIIQSLRLNKILVHYITATLVGILTFLPWGFFIVTQLEKLEKTIGWSKKIIPLSDLTDAWQINLSRIVFDITPNYSFPDKLQNDLWFLLIRFICIVFLYGIYFVYRQTSKKVWLLIFLLIGITSASQALPDVLFGGLRSVIPRYSIPIFIGYHLAIAYLFAEKAFLKSNSLLQRKIWRLIIILFLVLELISCYVIFPKTTWANKGFSSDNIPIVNIINQSQYPILICPECTGDKCWGSILSMSYYLKPTVKIQMFPEINISPNFNKFSDVFFLNASEKLQNHLKKEQNLDINLVYKNKLSLWKLKRFVSY
ncbi:MULTISPECIES: glycosyltransferase family 39 protein [Nostoc]|uniref:Glycosyltransferase family 39 protein n=1 Tax=Nostoc paludosum FACHB-159 TaxID=2692908 RepID=A0ABR8KHN9_9NOSO|nr:MULTISPECIES: glycosyltransferase family 39 protein [Nostoc]MBD2682042.1 glycosyltransferase family 39 protein [Nostoc sp. FACHB-857]MBD2738371.1 glycosyltransferase family 39 protein [Nostoc paludosum FACHB-159]